MKHETLMMQQIELLFHIRQVQGFFLGQETGYLTLSLAWIGSSKHLASFKESTQSPTKPIHQFSANLKVKKDFEELSCRN
jgi:hypothetical protein